MNSLSKDSLSKDSLSKDSLSKDSPNKDSILKDSLLKDFLPKDSLNSSPDFQPDRPDLPGHHEVLRPSSRRLRPTGDSSVSETGGELAPIL